MTVRRWVQALRAGLFLLQDANERRAVLILQHGCIEFRRLGLSSNGLLFQLSMHAFSVGISVPAADFICMDKWFLAMAVIGILFFVLLLAIGMVW